MPARFGKWDVLSSVRILRILNEPSGEMVRSLASEPLRAAQSPSRRRIRQSRDRPTVTLVHEWVVPKRVFFRSVDFHCLNSGRAAGPALPR